MNGLALIRSMDWRTSSSRSLNDSADQGGLIPVSSWIWRLNSSSLKVSIPQSVWWMRTISQRLLGTEEIVLIHHTDCGMLTFNDDEFRRQIQEDTGIKPPWSAESFSDLEDDVRQSIERIKASPFIPNKDAIRGFVYEVETGRLREVA